MLDNYKNIQINHKADVKVDIYNADSTSIVYNYNDDEEESLGKIVKRIKLYYYMGCLTLSNK